MNKDEYVIINRTKLLKEIDELEENRKNSSSDNNDYYLGQIKSCKEVLSNSIELIPEIEKAYLDALNRGDDVSIETSKSLIKDYINQLKLDI